MVGFELRISGVRGNRSANCATTTAQDCLLTIIPATRNPLKEIPDGHKSKFERFNQIFI